MSVIKSIAVFAAVVTLSVFAGIEFSGRMNSASANRSGAGQALAIKAAVVDIQEVTNDYLRKSGQLDVLLEKKGQSRNMLNVLRQQIDGQRSNLDIYPPEDPRYMDAQIDIAIKSAELKVRKEASQLIDDRDRANLTSEVYQKAVEAIRMYAMERNIDMVFLKQEGEFSQMTMEGVSSNILVRSVVFAKDQLDITQEIKNRMK